VVGFKLRCVMTRARPIIDVCDRRFGIERALGHHPGSRLISTPGQCPVPLLTKTPRLACTRPRARISIGIGRRAYQPPNPETPWNTDGSNHITLYADLYSSITAAHNPADLGAGDAWRLTGERTHPNKRRLCWKNVGDAMNASRYFNRAGLSIFFGSIRLPGKKSSHS